MPTVLIIDDTPQSARLLEAVLSTQGYEILSCSGGPEALDLLATTPVDLILLDISMPVMDGFEVCQRLRANKATVALPIIMMTSSGAQEKLRALEAGADDFVTKPFDRAELLARVKSLLRVKEYYDKVQEQAEEIRGWNRELQERVARQVEEIQRLARLRRFLSPQVADLIVTSGDAGAALQSHRRQVAVLFCDLHGFTAFAEVAEPEDVMTVLRQFHEVLGDLVNDLSATVGFFAGDGLMVLFNDPVPCPDPALRAVQLAVELRREMGPLLDAWGKAGHQLSFGVGITLGYATLGEIGFEGRFDYGAIGSVVNLASRLCDETGPAEILISQPVFAAVEQFVDVTARSPLTLKGFAKPIPAFSVVSLRATSPIEGNEDGLSSREVEVLSLVAAGYSNKEMADALTLSVRTIERHIANLYTKIGARNRADATAYAIGHGIPVPQRSGDR